MATVRESLLKVDELAEAWNVDPITVRRLIERGELRAVKIGTAIRVRPADARAYVEAHEKEPA